MNSICAFLSRQRAAGAWSVGQIAISDLTLRHVDDAVDAGSEVFNRPEAARELAKYDDAGNYRPLKTAPNLRHGWQVALSSVDELRLALDFFYPAAIGTWVQSQLGTLPVVPLRGVLGRQSGMYRVTQLITEEQAREVIHNICVEGCLRRRLWDVETEAPSFAGAQLPIPILCVEACNLFVAACRPLAKQNLPKTEASS